MIEDPDRPGHYICIISPRQYEDLLREPTPEELLQWELEDEWNNMFYGEAAEWHDSGTPPNEPGLSTVNHGDFS